MANAKETPRQKMIGMMYLVLTCLLALNVTKEVLDGFVTINSSIENTNSNFTINTKMMMEALDEAVKAGRNDVKPYYEKSKEVTLLSQKTFDYVGQLKKEVKQYTEDVKGADTMNLARIERLDDFDKPTFLLLGADEKKPKTGKNSAKELRENIVKFATALNLMIDTMHNKPGYKLPDHDYFLLKEKLKSFVPHDNYKDKEGHAMSWEFRNFYNMPLAAVITNLSKIQNDIKSIESGMISTFAAAAGKLNIPLDRLQARIVPVSQYVQSGTPYTADVFLTASSTHFTSENLQFILGDVDTTTGVLAPGAVVLPIDEGTGKVNLPTNLAGHQNIKGWIKFKDGTGLYKYFPYQNEFIVAKSAVAVSAEKMNVMYIGVENPINVSAAGVAPTDLVVSVSGGGATLVNSGNGKYIAKVTTVGSCSVTVMQKTAAGLKAQGPPQIFRVKKFPNPPMKIAGKTVVDATDMSPGQASILSMIGVDNSGFDFNAPFKVKSFTMCAFTNGRLTQDFKCENGVISPEAKAELSRVRKGSKIYFENIKVQAPDGERPFPIVKINVK